MPGPDLKKLERYLLRSGVAPRHVTRTIDELHDHFDDLEAEARRSGMSPRLACAHASVRLGDPRDIASEVVRRPELRSWMYRFPTLARVALPIAYAAMLPAASIAAGAELATVVVRWGACLLLSAAVTVLMLFAMQISIALS